MNIKYVCNSDNVKFINTENNLLIERSFFQDNNISINAKGIYFILAAKDAKMEGMTIDELKEYCSNRDKRFIKSALDELIKLNLIKAV